MFLTILVFVLVLGVLVFVHELGHFVMAKRFGIRVDEFGFGFPPRIIGLRYKDTIYSINAIPLGGFVKIKGESGDHSDDKDSFASRKPWQRIIILLAGVLMNIILAWALLTASFSLGMPQEMSDELLARGNVRDVSILITDVEDKSPAALALKAGDTIETINSEPFKAVDDVASYITDHQADELTIAFKRGATPMIAVLTPKLYGEHDRPLLGITMLRTGIVNYNIFEAAYFAAITTLSTLIAIALAFGGLLRDLFSGVGVSNQISGPVGVAVITGQIVKLGFVYILNFTAILSLNLGFLNSIPFPALDGGRTLFVILEKIKGRPISHKVETWFHTVGFGLLIMLVIFVTYKDILNYGDVILKGFGRLFQ